MSTKAETKQKKSSRIKKPLLLECRCRGKLFFSIHSEKMTFPFRIGKAPDNDLVLPANDRTSKDYEAFLDSAKGKLVLKAAEGRSFYVHGASKESYVLPQEDRVVIGDCELFIYPTKKLNDASQTHHLEFLNGPRKGKIQAIEQERILIGSGEKCDLQFQSDVVSENHAEIKLGPTGEAWVKDLESVNGTFVNGRRLSSQARVLMDMDKVSVACFDFRFQDKNVTHTRSHLVRNLLIMVVTLVAVIAVSAVLYLGIPHASQVAAAVDEMMRQEQFQAAAAKLKKMPESQEYTEYEAVYYNLKKRLELYQETYSAWQSFQKCIRQGKLNTAAQYIGQLDLTRENAWDWDASTVQKRMDFARRCVQIWLRYRELHTMLYVNPPVNPNIFHAIHADYVNDPVLKKAKDDPDWLNPLYKALNADIKELHDNCVKLDKINQALEAIVNGTGTFENAFAVLSAQHQHQGCLQIYIWQIQNILTQLDAAHKCIEQNIEALTDYKFERVNIKPDFPSVEVCRIHPTVVQIRAMLLSRHYRVLNAGITIQWAYGKKFREALTADRIQYYREATNKLLSVPQNEELSCFKMPLPQFLRKQKEAYEKRESTEIVMDTAFIYNAIQQTLTLEQTGYDFDALGENKALPLIKLTQLLKEIYGFAMQPENKFLLRNQFKEDIANAGIMLKLRHELVEKGNKIAEQNPGSRAYLIMKAAYFLNYPSANVPKEELDRYIMYWKQYRLKLRTLLDQYDPLMDKAQSARIRKEILKIAIPGDPLVSNVWNDVE